VQFKHLTGLDVASQLSYISVKTPIKKKFPLPYFSLGASCAHWV